MNPIKKDGRERLLEAIRDSTGSGLFYLYGADWTAQQELLRTLQNAAMEADPEGFDIAELDVRKTMDDKLVEVFARQPNGTRQVIIVHCADKMTPNQRIDFKSMSPFFLEMTLLILVNTPHTDKDEGLAKLQDMIEVEV